MFLPNLNLMGFFLTLAIIFGFLVFMVLLLRSGRGYAEKDVDAHAVSFPSDLKEGHGGMPAFLLVAFSAMLIWTIVYFVQHASEFAIIFSP
jgi:hypothetical protein